MKHTADICDMNEQLVASGKLKILPPIFKSYAKKKFISGEILTVKAIEDNSLVRSTLELPGNKRILIIDGAGSYRCALLGGALAKLAEKNKWEGVIVFGCVRDSFEVKECDVGVWALATHPKRSKKAGAGIIGEAIEIHGTQIKSGEFCIADMDGILVSAEEL